MLCEKVVRGRLQELLSELIKDGSEIDVSRFGL